MAKAHKLPSGKWRVRVYSHTDNLGKKHYESFTALTKQEAELMASKFANDNDRKRSADITVGEAVQSYIEANSNALSPSTLYGYKTIQKRLKGIESVRIRKITSPDIQHFISYMIDNGLSPKTIKNTYGLIRSALTFSGIDQEFMIHLPSIAKKTKIAPEHDQIQELYNHASKKMKIVIALAAFCSLRRGEIAALKYGDINGNTIYIHSDIVYGTDKKWHYKEVPKTAASSRTIYVHDNLLALIGTGEPDEFILKVNPNTIGENFRRLRKKLGIEITLHDLRHYFASLAKVLDIPDIYAASLGGWKNNSPVLKEVYQGNIVSMSEEYAQRLSGKFESMTQNVTRAK